MSLIDLPGNKGHIFAVNPHRVTAVQHTEGELAGRVGKHPLSVVWVDDHNLFVCAWPMEQTLAHLNEAKRTDYELFSAGYIAGATDVDWENPMPDLDKCVLAFKAHQESE